MKPMQKGRFLCRAAETPAEIRATQQLRQICFRRARGGYEQDSFDRYCRHILIEEEGGGPPVGCFRLLLLRDVTELDRSYSAQFYDLSALASLEGGFLELGRFCIRPGCLDPDILRLAWAALTREVDHSGAGMLLGCTSFSGLDPDRYRDAFAYLATRHLAPANMAPGRLLHAIYPFAEALAGYSPDPKAALRQMPSILRSYLSMGGWVSDHAVIDPALDTMHVFTGVEISAIPGARARLLRAIAA
ncbi:MAG: GNAT family N-acetyltransferase [Pseudorhodobacter sp.]